MANLLHNEIYSMALILVRGHKLLFEVTDIHPGGVAGKTSNYCKKLLGSWLSGNRAGINYGPPMDR